MIFNTVAQKLYTTRNSTTRRVQLWSMDGVYDTEIDLTAKHTEIYYKLCHGIGGRLYVGDINGRFISLWINGVWSKNFGSDGFTAGKFRNLFSMDIDNDGNLYTTDPYKVLVANTMIQKFDPDGTLITAWGTEHGLGGELDVPHGIVVSPTHVFVSDTGYNKIFKYLKDGTLITSWDIGADGNYLTMDENYNIYVSNGEIYDAAGTLLDTISLPTVWVVDLRATLSGKLYYIYYGDNVFRCDYDGTNSEEIDVVYPNWPSSFALKMIASTAGSKKYNSTISMDGGNYIIDNKKYNSIISMVSLSGYNKKYNSIISLSNDLYQKIPFEYTLSERLFLACKARILGFTDDGHMPFNNSGGTL